MNKPVKRRADDATRSGTSRKRLTPADTSAEGVAVSQNTATDPTNAANPVNPKNVGDIVSMRSEDLMGHREKIEIVHKGERYVLRLTRLGRLILTK